MKNLQSYAEVVLSISNLPITWYPGVLSKIVKECLKRGVFKVGMISDFVKRIEDANK